MNIDYEHNEPEHCIILILKSENQAEFLELSRLKLEIEDKIFLNHGCDGLCAGIELDEINRTLRFRIADMRDIEYGREGIITPPAS